MFAKIGAVVCRAGVSRPTVWRVIADRPNVGENLRQWVLMAVGGMGYVLGRVACSLLVQPSTIIGLITSDIQNSLLISLVRAVGNAVCELACRVAKLLQRIEGSIVPFETLYSQRRSVCVWVLCPALSGLSVMAHTSLGRAVKEVF